MKIYKSARDNSLCISADEKIDELMEQLVNVERAARAYMAEVDTTIARKDAAIDGLLDRIDRMNEQAGEYGDEVQNRWLAITTSHANLQQDLNDSTRTIEALNEKIDVLVEQNNGYRDRLCTQRDSIQIYQRKIEGLITKVEVLEVGLRNRDDKISLQEGEIKDLRADLEADDIFINDLAKEVEAYEGRIKQHEQHISELEAERLRNIVRGKQYV